MLIEKQVKLVEGRTADLPVGLLVQIAQRDGIGQQQIQTAYYLLARRRFQADRQVFNDCAVLLN